MHYQPTIDGPVGTLRGRMIHRDHADLYHYFARHNRYSDWEAALRSRGGIGRDDETQTVRRSRLKRAFAKMPFRPLGIFVYSYVLAGGFLDGRAGFNYAVSRGFYYWQIGLKLRERDRRSGCNDAERSIAGATRSPARVRSFWYARPVAGSSRQARRERAANAGASTRSRTGFRCSWSTRPSSRTVRPSGSTMRLTPSGRSSDRRAGPFCTMATARRSSAAPSEVSTFAERRLSWFVPARGWTPSSSPQAGAEVIALDVSLGALRRASERKRRHGFELFAVVGDAARLPFRDASVDVVFVHDGLHHLDDPLAGLAEMARVARSAVCVSEPARAWITAVAVRAGLALEREEAGNRVGRLDAEAVEAELRKEGFRILESQRYGMYYRHEPGRLVRLLSYRGLCSRSRRPRSGWRTLSQAVSETSSRSWQSVREPHSRLVAELRARAHRPPAARHRRVRLARRAGPRRSTW